MRSIGPLPASFKRSNLTTFFTEIFTLNSDLICQTLGMVGLLWTGGDEGNFRGKVVPERSSKGLTPNCALRLSIASPCWHDHLHVLPEDHTTVLLSDNPVSCPEEMVPCLIHIGFENGLVNFEIFSTSWYKLRKVLCNLDCRCCLLLGTSTDEPVSNRT